MATPKPKEATWSTAKLYRVDLYNVKWPRSGTRLVWAVVGKKVGTNLYTYRVN